MAHKRAEKLAKQEERVRALRASGQELEAGNGELLLAMALETSPNVTPRSPIITVDNKEVDKAEEEKALLKVNNHNVISEKKEDQEGKDGGV